MTSFAEFITQCPDSDTHYLRELLADDVRLECTTKFARGPHGDIQFLVPPAPLHWSRSIEWPWVLRNGDFKRTHKVLEVAGGHTVLKFALARRADRVYLAEYEKDYMPKIQETIDQLAVDNPVYSDMVMVHADARDLPFTNNSFERVVCVSTLEHIEQDRLKAIEEMLRVLRPGGRLLITMDIALQGDFEPGFFIAPQQAAEIADRLGVKLANNQVTTMSKLGQMVYTVLMICYDKPENA